MNVIKFLYMRPAGYGKGYTDSGSVDLVFDICPELAKRLLRHARCPSYRLCTILDEGYNYYYRFILERDGHDRERITYFIKKVEQISNEKDDIYLFEHVITNNKNIWVPGDLRNLITEKYEVSDENDMLYVYHFFLILEQLLLNVWDD